jgi:hypothetical protein
MRAASFINKHRIAILLFFCTNIIGLIIYKDFGISYDEKAQRNLGLLTYNFVFHGEDSLKTNVINRDYGVGFALPLIIIEKILRLKDSREIFLMRHLVTHLFFLVSAFVFYLLIYILYRSRILGILGYLILLLSPPIYAHSFFNCKDIPFMSMFIICFFMCEIAFQKWRALYFILFGICTGLLINIRIMGLMFILFATIFMLSEGISSFNKINKSKYYLLYIICAIATLIITWPYLWENPIGNLARAFTTFSKFPHSRMSCLNLMFGQLIKPTEIKWYYIPFWFSVTTPIPIIAGGLAGTIFVIINIIRKPLKFITNIFNRNQLMYLFCFYGSIFSVIILHSVLYDGWRQMYFIYPSFILLNIYGINYLLNVGKRNFRLFASATVFVIFIFTLINMGWYMIQIHPFQNIYFNNFLSNKEQYLHNNFEMDNWGTTNKQAMEYVLSNNISDKIYIGVFPSGRDNAMILRKNDRERLIFVNNLRDCEYFISNYYCYPSGFGFPASTKVFNIKVLNSDIISVWKLK